MRQKAIAPIVTLSSWKKMVNLYDHQKKIIEQAPDKIGLFWGTGTGKTCAAIRLAEKKSDTCLVICPKSIKEKWKEDIIMFGEKKTKFFIYTKEEFRRDVLSIPDYKCVIVDEVHFFSGPKSQMHKSLRYYLKHFQIPYLYVLTATPYMANCWSVYALGKILGRDWDWWQWNSRFFDTVYLGSRPAPGQPDRRKRIWTQKKNIETAIADIVNKLGITLKLEDLFDVPDQIYLTEYFDLTKEQKAAIANIDDTEAIVRWTKEHCIENGVLKSDGYTEDQFFPSEKTQRVVKLCQEHKKIAVVARYRLQLQHYYDILSKNHKVYVIHGDVKDRHEIIKKVNEEDDCVVLIQGACSAGYDLWSVPVMVFASYDFSLVNYVQIKGRLQRANHIKKNVYISLLVKKGVDYDVFDNVVNKKQDFHAQIYAYSKETPQL